MSTTVDSRVLEMRFDNSHFEKNVQTSMSTLEKLKQSLNFTFPFIRITKKGTARKNTKGPKSGNNKVAPTAPPLKRHINNFNKRPSPHFKNSITDFY